MGMRLAENIAYYIFSIVVITYMVTIWECARTSLSPAY